MIEIKNIDKNNFPRRTFRAEDETNILGDSISFNYIQNCPDCNKLIDIENISLDYKNMKKDSLWAQCKLCNQYILPQLTVKLGSDINYYTSSLDKLLLEEMNEFEVLFIKLSIKNCSIGVLISSIKD